MKVHFVHLHIEVFWKKQRKKKGNELILLYHNIPVSVIDYHELYCEKLFLRSKNAKAV